MPPLPSGEEIRPMGKVQDLVQSTAAKKGAFQSLAVSSTPGIVPLFLLLDFSPCPTINSFFTLVRFITHVIPVFVLIMAVSGAWCPLDPP